MRTDDELAAASNTSLVDSFRKLVRHVPGAATRDFAGIVAYATGLPLSLFNGIVVVEPAAERDLQAAIDWIDERAVPSRAFIDERRAPDARRSVIDRGFVPDGMPYPGMALHPVPEQPIAPSTIDIVPVTARELDEHVAVRAAMGLSPDLARRLYPQAFAEDPDVRLFTVKLDGVPVGASAAIHSGDIGGVYAVGTIKTARRRGVGTAASWAAVAACREWGCDTVVLQASEMGYHVYETMGFRTVVPYTTLKRAFPVGVVRDARAG